VKELKVVRVNVKVMDFNRWNPVKELKARKFDVSADTVTELVDPVKELKGLN